MILDSENHRRQILDLLNLPGLALSADEGENLPDKAREYLSLFDAVTAASVGGCECRSAGFAHVLTELDTPEG